MTSATAFGPSSVANLGVGFDALGVALEGPGDLVTASVSRREGIRLVSVKGDRGRLPRDPERNTAAVAATQVLALAKERGSKVKGLDLELETAESRRVLPRLISLSDHIRQGAAFAELVAALHTGDLVAAGRCVSSDRIVEPARAPLVPGHAAVTRAMKKAGAFGVALAGAGPSLLAVSAEGPRPAKIAQAAVEAWKAEGVAAVAEVHRIDPLGAREA